MVHGQEVSVQELAVQEASLNPRGHPRSDGQK